MGLKKFRQKKRSKCILLANKGRVLRGKATIHTVVWGRLAEEKKEEGTYKKEKRLLESSAGVLSRGYEKKPFFLLKIGLKEKLEGGNSQGKKKKKLPSKDPQVATTGKIRKEGPHCKRGEKTKYHL